ncbi:hypothetical protein LX32DRAFT_453858 [Colletotrichum zoysiae]|uniref:Uncharacterized protein n=1 Tax=Colletotrichum zoysiae TaxID=1216348 RepID=A0AAD9HF32_9PEZI|nr:hypothetical protein LX32DRAFT_453858 [Colletotrichum zoysiae]
MALPVDIPYVAAPSARVFVDESGDNEADGDVAFEPSWRAWPTTQKIPSDGTTMFPDDRMIHFDGTTFGGEDRVIITSNDTHVIKWTTKFSVTIMNAFWLGNEIGERGEVKELFRNKADFSDQSSATSHSSSDSSLTSTRAKREERVILDGDSLSLPVRDLNPSYADANMYIELVWTSGDQSGTTTSGVFALFNGVVPSEEYSATIQRIRNLTSGDDAQLNGSENHGDAALPPATRSTETSALPSSTATGGASIPAIAPNGSGLTPGAIAGVVIGSVFGLSLIAFLVWFFLRQRHRAGQVSDGGTHEYLADKEAHARAAESPHSPYSDDGRQPQQQLEQHHYLHQGGPEVVVGAAERSSLTPFDEEGHTPIATRSMEDTTRSGVASSTPNATTNVSHLIEDGMTEEEIRRLEDEERALDDAIEQAGQGQGRGRKP